MVAIVYNVELHKHVSTFWMAKVDYKLFDNGELQSDSSKSIMLDMSLDCSVIRLTSRIAEALKNTYPDDDIKIVETSTLTMR